MPPDPDRHASLAARGAPLDPADLLAQARDHDVAIGIRRHAALLRCGTYLHVRSGSKPV
jgi:hypothetical protein